MTRLRAHSRHAFFEDRSRGPTRATVPFLPTISRIYYAARVWIGDLIIAQTKQQTDWGNEQPKQQTDWGNEPPKPKPKRWWSRG